MSLLLTHSVIVGAPRNRMWWQLGAVALAVMILCAACEFDEGASNDRRRRGGPVPHSVSCADLRNFIERTQRGYVPVRSPDLSLIPHEPNYVGTPYDAVHTGPYDFLAEVPLVMFGPGHIPAKGAVRGPATMADVAPTIARLIGFDDYDALDGQPLLNTPSGRSSKPPRLVVTLVWDGGGWNTLRQHPNSWPFLASIIDRGVSFEQMTIGSTPSVTPPIHTTLGTGAFPRHHGIPHVRMTTDDSDYIDPFEGNSPRFIRTPTLGDIYDRSMDNKPLVGVVATVNWHLGMIGHGALFKGGDLDLAVLLNSAGYVYGDPSIYEVPSDLSGPRLLSERALTLDMSDGDDDGKWRGHDLANLSVLYASPASVEFQEVILERTLTERGFGRDRVPDLLFSNFKSIDAAGHHWGMTSPEMGEAIAATDAALQDLVAALNSQVGRNNWVVVVTADHGTAMYPEESGGWAIRGHDLEVDLNREFDVAGPVVVERVNSAGIFLNEEQRARIDISAIGNWILDYTASDNLYQIDEIPEYYADRAEVPLFDAVLEGSQVVARSCGD